MDNENKNAGSDWLDEILGNPNTPKELGPDEIAVAAAGLTHPDDMELEQIIQETMSESWADIPLVDASEPTAKLMSLSQEEPTETVTPIPLEESALQEEAVLPEETDTASAEADTSVSAEQDTADTTPAPTPRRKKVPAAQDSEAANINPNWEETTEKKRSFWESVKAFFVKMRKPKPPKDNLWGLPHLVASLIWIVVIVGIGASVGRMGWLCACDVLALGKTPQELEFVIDEEDNISTVAKRLKNLGMIEYPSLFELFAKITGKGSNLQEGTVFFSGDIVYDYNALVSAMSYKSTAKETIEIVVPEGYSCAQIFQLLEEKGVCTIKELEEYAANGNLTNYWFLEGVKRGNRYCLEGYLFPDTYEFYLNDSPRRVLEKFLDDFNYRFNDRMQEKFEALNKNLKNPLTVRELIILSSIIEKEKANHLEGYSISSVFHNRLRHSASYPFLNSDATLLYDVEYYTGSAMTSEQKENSPYNTYTQKGLPIAPISNPGLGSIDAALSPETTDYFYFIFDKKAGHHLFSKTLAEHQKKAKELGLA